MTRSFVLPRAARVKLFWLVLFASASSRLGECLSPEGHSVQPSSSYTSPLFRSPSVLSKTTTTRIPLGAKTPRYRGYRGDDEEREHDDIGRQRSTDRPTQTVFGVDEPPVAPAKPKIVVLGATGRVGRLVVRQLLEMESVDMTVVAFCRDYDKAIRVLYDDLVVAKANKKGPKLQIVEGDLVPPEELPGFSVHDTEDEKVWRKTAESAAKYFGNKMQDYDNRELLPNVNESLEEALKGCTTVISCLGAFRPTNLWTDILARPFWRLLRSDVSKWCKDAKHPFYVHYASTLKALGCVEREQRRREAAAATLAEDEDDNTESVKVPRIRFIRISDLGVGHRPWHFVPLVTNVVQSVIFRYHEMAENLLESSNLVETVILRPGDLVDDERDVNTTALQVSHTGIVPSPARIGRDDVASLAVAAAMFQTPEYDFEDETAEKKRGPFHYTLACRWVGQELDPFPAQGVKADGAADATTALRRTLQVIEKNVKRKRALERRRQRRKTPQEEATFYDRTKTSVSDWVVGYDLARRKRTNTQPHGLCVAIPVYVMLGLFARTLLHPLIKILPGGQTWILPALAQVNELVLVAVSMILAKLAAILPFVARRKQYILF